MTTSDNPILPENLPEATSTQLEVIDDPVATHWAAVWSDATDAAMNSLELREELRSKILAALDSDERIPGVNRRGQWLYNFWRDAEHPRGLWRRTSLESFLSGSPEWLVLVDVDKLAEEENEPWVWKGAQVLRPECDRALVQLSRGGADAVVVREFDLESISEVTENPFSLPEAKTSLSWVDRDRLLVGTDLGPETLTHSGYPAQTRLWCRGTSLEEAPVIAHGDLNDVAAGTWVDNLPGSKRVCHIQAIDFYHAKQWIAPIEALDHPDDIAWQQLNVPTDCEVMLHRDLAFLIPRSPCLGMPAGALGMLPIKELTGEAGSVPEATVLFAPDEHTALQNVTFTRDYLLITTSHDVATELKFAPFDALDHLETLPIGEAVTASVVASSAHDGNEVWVEAANFTQPPVLYRFDLGEHARALPQATTAWEAPALFDASGLITRQLWATSADGTQIPYYVTGPQEAMRILDGADPSGPLPTLVTAYGGFEVSLFPSYQPVAGIGWLERGYLYVQANIRGGGEFGPDWHSQAIKHNRTLVFDDHEAVLRDLVARGLTTPELIAIRGGSNGGLLTATALTRYPECMGAVVSQVPLTDMLRYHKWSAGASWMAEYGARDDPELREIITSYSPLHNVAAHSDQVYPPALVTTSTRDDRVHPAHARLLARELLRSGQRVDYFENTEGGHAGAADNAQSAKVESLIYTWISQQLGVAGPAQ